MEWPTKYNVLGMHVSKTTYEDASRLIVEAAQKGVPAIVTHMPVHGLVLTAQDSEFAEKINSFDIVAPDGQPIRWCLELLHGIRLPDRVYGPQHMLHLCREAEKGGVGIYLYGSYPDVAERLRINLLRQFPSLRILGYESPPFRPLSQFEDTEMVDRVNKSGAGLMFIGLGCPLQDNFAFDHRQKIQAVKICVGAAFDFHAGNKRTAPEWMQARGLEWLFRFMEEPSRLWKRYLLTNGVFIVLLLKEIVRQHMLLRLLPRKLHK